MRLKGAAARRRTRDERDIQAYQRIIESVWACDGWMWMSKVKMRSEKKRHKHYTAATVRCYT